MREQQLGVGFVIDIARRINPPANIYDDVIGAGLLALERAKRSYDPKKGDFAAYAAPAVFRAIVAETRKLLNIVVPPRTAPRDARGLAAPLSEYSDRGAREAFELRADILLFADRLSVHDRRLLREVLLAERELRPEERPQFERIMRELRNWLKQQGY